MDIKHSECLRVETAGTSFFYTSPSIGVTAIEAEAGFAGSGGDESGGEGEIGVDSFTPDGEF